MTVAHDATVSAQGGGVSSLGVSLTIAGNSARYILVHGLAGHSSTPSAFSSVSWNGSESLSNVWSRTAGDFTRIEAWGLVAPTATTASANITFGGSRNQVGIIASSYYGVDQSVPLGAARTATGTGSSPTAWIGVDDAESNGMVVGCAGQGLDAAGTPTQAGTDGIANYRAVGTASQSNGATSLAPALPSGTQPGDLVFATCMSENNETHACSTTSWTKLAQHHSGASFTVSFWYAIEDGALSAPTITWTSSVGCGAKCVTHIDVDADTPLAALGTQGAGTGSTHSSTGGNTAQDDVLAIYADHCNANTALAQPSGWVENSDAGSATGPNRYVYGSKDVASGGTGSGDISVTGGTAAWVQKQFEIFPGPTQTHRDEEEDISGDGFCSFGVADEVGASANTLVWAMSGGATTWGAGAVALRPAASGTAVAPPHLADGDAFYSLTLERVALPSAVVSDGDQFFVPRVSNALKPTAHGGEPSFSGPTLGLLLSAETYASAATLYAPTIEQAGLKGAPLVAGGSAAFAPRVEIPLAFEVVGTLDVAGWAPRAPARRARAATWPNLPKVGTPPPWRLVVVTPEIARRRVRALMAFRARSERARRKQEEMQRADRLWDEIVEAQVVRTVVRLVDEEV